MKLQQLGTNRTLVQFNNGTEVFFSYETPVAGYAPGLGIFRTDKQFSVTTSRHIGEYLRRRTGESGYGANRVPQADIEQLVGAHTL